MSDSDYQTLSRKAESARVSLSGYLRNCALDAPQVKARRSKPAPSLAEIARLLVALNRIGNNLNQIARSLHAGGIHAPEDLQDSLRALLAMKRDVLELLA